MTSHPAWIQNKRLMSPERYQRIEDVMEKIRKGSIKGSKCSWMILEGRFGGEWIDGVLGKQDGLRMEIYSIHPKAIEWPKAGQNLFSNEDLVSRLPETFQAFKDAVSKAINSSKMVLQNLVGSQDGRKKVGSGLEYTRDKSRGSLTTLNKRKSGHNGQLTENRKEIIKMRESALSGLEKRSSGRSILMLTSYTIAARIRKTAKREWLRREWKTPSHNVRNEEMSIDDQMKMTE